MGKLIQSWFFFTALLLFFLAAAVSLPKLGQRLFGDTEVRLETAVNTAESQVQAVWAQIKP